MADNIQPSQALGEEVFDDMYYDYQEACEINGYKIQYLRAQETQGDAIFQESTAREFLDSMSHDMYVKKSEDAMFSGGEFFGGFGALTSYQGIYYIPKKYFDELGFEPIEGDLIEDDRGTLFEISKVDSLLETESELRVNDMVFGRKIYVVQYKFNYSDDLEDDILNTSEFSAVGMDAINDALELDIENEGVVDTTKDNDLFDEWGS